MTYLTDVTRCHEAVGPEKIAEECEMRSDLVRKTLGRMVQDGEIIKEKRGLYVHAGRRDLQKR